MRYASWGLSVALMASVVGAGVAQAGDPRNCLRLAEKVWDAATQEQKRRMFASCRNEHRDCFYFAETGAQAPPVFDKILRDIRTCFAKELGVQGSPVKMEDGTTRLLFAPGSLAGDGWKCVVSEVEKEAGGPFTASGGFAIRAGCTAKQAP